MTKKSKYIVPGFDKILDYIHKRMGNKNRHSFEKQLQKDLFLEDAVEGLSMISEKRARNDIKSISNLIKKKQSNSTKITIRAIAAVAALLIITGISYLAIEKYHDSLDDQLISREEPVHSPKEEYEEIILFEKEEPIPEKPESPATSSRVLTEPAERARASQRPSAIVVDEATDIVADFEIVEEDVLDPELSLDFQAEFESPDLFIISHYEESAEESGYKTITGKVIDAADGALLPAVSIVISGTSKGVVTDVNGTFSIDIPVDKDVTLIASFVGMKTLEFSPEQITDNTLAMHSDIDTLSEIVVVAHGTEIKRFNRSLGYAVDTYLEDEEDYPPKPVVGYEEFEIYLNEKAKLPKDSYPRRAIVVLDFEINISGEPQNFVVHRSPDDDFSSTAIELIKNGPKWIPAKSDDEIIVEKVRVRIVFRK